MYLDIWAENEIRIACEREKASDVGDNINFKYRVACYESAFKAFKSLMEDEHSGMSIGFTKHILNRLIECKPLSPIEDTPDIWNETVPIRGRKRYQCSRISSLFKYIYPDGTVKYHDVDRVLCATITDKDVFYHSILVSDIIDEMFPITMPYWPTKEFKVYTEEFLVDQTNGDFDTVCIRYAIDPDGNHIEINRYFAEKDGEMVEISREEYVKRLEYAKR